MFGTTYRNICGWFYPVLANDVRERSAPKIEVTGLRSTWDHRECTREKFEETSQRPVRRLLSPLAGLRSLAAMKSTKREVRHRHRRWRFLFRNGEERVTRVQLAASQRSWHGASFRLETRIETEPRKRLSVGLNLKCLKRYASSRGRPDVEQPLALLRRKALFALVRDNTTWYQASITIIEGSDEGLDRGINIINHSKREASLKRRTPDEEK